MAIKLEIKSLESPDTATVQELDQSLVTFGRSKSCHVELDHAGVSRRHFMLKFLDDVYIVLDEGSRHGTIIDGQKIVPGEPYPIGRQHIIDLPGYQINLSWDGQRPKLERTTVVARQLLDELLQGHVKLRDCPSLRAQDHDYHFKFVEEKSSFVLGTLPFADFVVRDDTIGTKHLSFARDINGIRLIPLPTHQVFLDGQPCEEPQLLAHGQKITVGNIDFRYQEPDHPEAQEAASPPAKHNEPINEEPVVTERAPEANLTTPELAREAAKRTPTLRILDRAFLLVFVLALAGASVMFFELI